MGHRLQVVDRVQLGTLVGRIVHAGDAAAELEPEVRVVAQLLNELGEMPPVDVEGDLASVDDHLGDHVGVARHELTDPVVDLIPPPTERWRGGRRELDGACEATVAGGVAGAVHAEHALPGLDHLRRGLGLVDCALLGRLVGLGLVAGHVGRSTGGGLASRPGVRLRLALRHGTLDRRLRVGLGVRTGGLWGRLVVWARRRPPFRRMPFDRLRARIDRLRTRIGARVVAHRSRPFSSCAAGVSS